MFAKCKALLYRFNDQVGFLGNVCIVANVLFVTINVVLRSGFNVPVAGFTDISGMISCLIVAFAIAYTEKENGHIGVDFIVARFPKILQRILGVIIGLLNAGISGVLCVFFFDYGLGAMKAGTVTMTAKLPYAPFIFACSFGMLLVTATVLVKTADKFLIPRKENA